MHRAVIFAIAQLSCYIYDFLQINKRWRWWWWWWWWW